MSFLSPILLVLAAAAAVPLLLHLRTRHADSRIDFPAVRYLERAERERSREMRLRNLLLMLLRVAAVLAIALAAARPMARLGGRFGAAAGHAPMALAIVLDNTLSSSAVVNNAPALDVLKAAARRVAEAAGASDRVWLVTASGEVSGGAVAADIAGVEPFAGDGGMARAVAAAAAVVAASPIPEHRLAIVTDGQPTSWEQPIDLGTRVGSVSIVRPALALPANRAVLSADARPMRWTPAGDIVAQVRGPDTATYRLTLGGRTLARGTAVESEEIVVRASPTERGWVAGSVEIQPDEMRGDDIRHFAAWVGPPARVRVDTSAGRFVETAVDVLIKSGRLAAGGDITVAAAQDAASLPALLIAPSDPLFMGAANRGLERVKVPWSFTRDVKTDATVQDIAGASSVAVHDRFRVALTSAARVDTLARVNGEPWIVAGDDYVLVTSALTPGATDLPAGAAFLPWLTDVLGQRLAGRNAMAIAAVPGQRLSRPDGVDAIRSADGTQASLTGPTFQAPRTPGVAMLLAGGTPVAPVIVNVDPRESALGQLDPAILGTRIIGPSVRVVDDTSRAVDATFAGTARWPLSRPLLVLALIALAVETTLTAFPGRAHARGVEIGGAASSWTALAPPRDEIVQTHAITAVH